MFKKSQKKAGEVKKRKDSAVKKKQKKDEYQERKGLFGSGKDYHVYHMTQKDYIISCGIGFIAAAIVLYAFFSIPLISIAGGLICCRIVPKYYREYRKKKQLNELRLEFKDLLESLTASYSAGLNTMDSFISSLDDIISIYGEEADIVHEVKLICMGLRNNINIEPLLIDFAERSGLDDVMSFANVFEVCNRQGGDLKKVVADTREIINDKIEVEMEIETMLSGSVNELNIMMAMPVVIVVMLGGLGTSASGTNTVASFLVKAVCLGIFGISYVIGRRMIDIRI